MDKRDKLDNYPVLTQSGRFFPSWISASYRKFKLEEALKIAGQDPCRPKEGTKELKQELRKYQLFISQFLDYKSIYRTILLFHGLGSIICV